MTGQIYKKKTEWVEAVCLTVDNVEEVQKWCDGRLIAAPNYGPYSGKPGLEVFTPSSSMYANPGDWVVKTEDSNYLVLDEISFDRYYELDDEENPDGDD